VMSNLGLDKSLAEAGLRLVRTDVGDPAVCREMRANGYNLGGEWHKIVKGFTAASIIVLVLAIVAVVVVIWHRWRSMHAHGAAADQET